MRPLNNAIRRVLIVSGLVLGSVSISAGAEELPLNPLLATELNRVLQAGDALHKSLVAQNEEQIEIDIHQLLWQIGSARDASATVKPHERGHIVLILDSAQREFEQTRTLYGEERRTRLEKGYDQIVNLLRIYRLDRAYSIFYCRDDNTSWIQKGQRGQNPFRPKTLKNCGIRVERSR